MSKCSLSGIMMSQSENGASPNRGPCIHLLLLRPLQLDSLLLCLGVIYVKGGKLGLCLEPSVVRIMISVKGVQAIQA